MATLKDERVAREQALDLRWKRERAAAELATAQTRLRNLEVSLAQPDTAATSLKSILALIEDVPNGIHTRGNDLLPGGYVARDFLRKIAADALADVTTKRQRLEADLPLAQQRVEQAARAVAQLNPSHSGDARMRAPEFAARGTGAVR